MNKGLFTTGNTLWGLSQAQADFLNSVANGLARKHRRADLGDIRDAIVNAFAEGLEDLTDAERDEIAADLRAVALALDADEGK